MASSEEGKDVVKAVEEQLEKYLDLRQFGKLLSRLQDKDGCDKRPQRCQKGN